MKSRTAGSISETSHELRKGPTPAARLVRAATVGAIAGGLLGAGVAITRRKSPEISETARKLKGWAKSAARSSFVKYLVADAAHAIASKSNKGTTRRGQSVSARRKH